MRRPLAAALAVVAGAATLTSCGMLDRADGDDAAKAATVVVLVPDGTSSGDGVAAALQLGLDESMDEIDGWTVDVQVVDDQAEDVSLDERASEIVDDDTVAVVGGLSTETVRAVQPTFDAASLLFASPADTVPEHTRGADDDNPLRPYQSYFQTAVGDDDPLVELARYAMDTLDVKTVAVVDAGGEGEADAFAGAFRETEGKVLRVDEREAKDTRGSGNPKPRGGGDGEAAANQTPPGDGGEQDGSDGQDGEQEATGDQDDGSGGAGGDDGTEDAPQRRGQQDPISVDDVEAMVSDAQSGKADAVFVSGSPDVAAAVSDEIDRRGLELRLLGGSVLMSETFQAEAGSSAEGALTAVASELSPEGAAGPGDFQATMADSGVDPGPYGAAAYDTGVALGTTLERCLPSAGSASAAREGCVGEFAEMRFDGVTGEFAFDEYGGRVGAAPAIMRMRDGVWSEVERP